MRYTPAQALRKLQAGNLKYLPSHTNPGNISPAIRIKDAVKGQHPYAVVLTCSDSRVPPEHIFSAGIGQLFVVRTAGNVVGAFEIGTIEYGVKHLKAPLVLVMGHTQCGAVAAALEGHAEGYIEDIIEEIRSGLCGEPTLIKAIWENIYHSKETVMQSEILQKAVHYGKASIVCALYDTATGKVKFENC